MMFFAFYSLFCNFLTDCTQNACKWNMHNDDSGPTRQSDMATTANIYSHIDSTSKKETAQAIGELLG